MKLQYVENKKLPGLAWIATVLGGTVAVTHGTKVETEENFFVEGAGGGTSQLLILILPSGSVELGP